MKRKKNEKKKQKKNIKKDVTKKAINNVWQVYYVDCVCGMVLFSFFFFIDRYIM